MVLGVLWQAPVRTGAQATGSARRVQAVQSVVVSFRELARQEARTPRVAVVPDVPPFLPDREEEVPPGLVPPRPAQVRPLDTDPAPKPLSPAPALNFEALFDNGVSIPPDTQGAVGPNHLMVALNPQVRIQDRSGNQISLMSHSTFWSPLAGVSSPFDPKLLYDPFNNRWIFVAVSNRRSAESSILIGATQTNDPTGGWNLHRVDADSTDLDWADYPSIGFNKDWILVTVNMFTNAADAFSKVKIFAFDKAGLYAGNPATATELTDSVIGATVAPATTYDNTLATMYMVRTSSSSSALLRVSTITGSVGSETLTANAVSITVPQGGWNFSPSGSADFAPQMGTSEKIQNNDSRMLTVVYRNGSLWTAQTIFLPAGGTPTRSAVQWGQFTPSGTIEQFGRIEDANGALFYAYPSLAVNSRNDALVGYSSFSANQFASAAYSFRAAGDPLNTMRSSLDFKAGEASYVKRFTGTRNRWGDYSNTVVDPLNDLDFWTIQEYAGTPAGGGCSSNCDRWGTWWAKVSPPAARKRRAQVISQ
jgi:hypothetical protein